MDTSIAVKHKTLQTSRLCYGYGPGPLLRLFGLWTIEIKQCHLLRSHVILSSNSMVRRSAGRCCPTASTLSPHRMRSNHSYTTCCSAFNKPFHTFVLQPSSSKGNEVANHWKQKDFWGVSTELKICTKLKEICSLVKIETADKAWNMR